MPKPGRIDGKVAGGGEEEMVSAQGENWAADDAEEIRQLDRQQKEIRRTRRRGLSLFGVMLLCCRLLCCCFCCCSYSWPLPTDKRKEKKKDGTIDVDGQKERGKEKEAEERERE